jgi:hypothetical protein
MLAVVIQFCTENFGKGTDVRQMPQCREQRIQRADRYTSGSLTAAVRAWSRQFSYLHHPRRL